MNRRTLLLCVALSVAITTGASAQATPQSAPPPPPAAAPVARPADVASPDAIIASLYDVISGPAGKERDWDRFRSLFIPGARLIPTRPRPDGGANARVMTPDDYVNASGAALTRNGFFEREIHRETESYGNVMHVFSTYESRRTAADPQPFARGINSIQLLKDGNRWWVVTVYWDSEREGNRIPEKYLPK